MLVICLASLPSAQWLYAVNPPQALGHVLAKMNTVYIGNSSIPSGTTIFNGDSIRASSAPALLNLANGGRIEIGESSELNLQGSNQTTLMQNVSGSARFQFPSGAPLVIRTSQVTIKSAQTGSNVAGQISVNKDKVTFVAERGEFNLVDNATSEVRTVKEGEVARLQEGSAQETTNEAASTAAENAGSQTAGSTAGAGTAATKGGLFGLGKAATAVIVAGAAAAAVAIPVAVAATSTVDASPIQ